MAVSAPLGATLDGATLYCHIPHLVQLLGATLGATHSATLLPQRYPYQILEEYLGDTTEQSV